MSKKKTIRAAVQTISATELKTWIDGYCSAHDANWTPTSEQWQKILEKIYSLETVPSYRNDEPRHATANQRRDTSPPAQYQQPQSNQSYTIPDMPAPSSSLGGTSATRAPIVRTSTGALKTPDLDASDAGNSFV